MRSENPMQGLRVYIAGPMSSAGGNYNFPLFDEVAKRFRAQGAEVFNPADLARRTLGTLEQIQKLDKKTFAEARRQLLKEELVWIWSYAQLLALLPGWQQSEGATLERQVALVFGIRIHETGDIVLPAGG